MRVIPEISALARRMHTAPCYIADAFGVNPIFVEQLLAMRGHRCADGESLFDLVARVYGSDVAKEMDRLIEKEAWEE